ncbi:hypothetical protein GRI62_11750 [Erythrobacter arachoides]|uniref:Uncharacterized protein n=1 Tax=Aurantiacibacter arachoides TaxID=1850444 RepID=A0A845A9L7_9SPHN|nr:hypothetical protein [Aurantiacibacter arachoides]MXO94269.1 hypothetical protein [Aurantiacibacter arachoides]GGD64821.1 hypothetical protein GCM10011411_26390 [Aurantiacibacter arachoides]
MHQFSIKTTRQILSAIEGKTSEFVSAFIIPHLHSADYYISLQNEKKTTRNDRHTLMAMADPHYLDNMAFFTNPLLNVDFETDEELFRNVNKRVVIAPIVILTFEFDVDDVEFVEAQMAWARGKRDACRHHAFYQLCRDRFHDLRGMAVNFSGQKSFHYHFAFSTDHVGIRDFPLDGYKRAWSKLETVFAEFFDLATLKVAPDPALKNAGNYRRLPNGLRILDKPNVFGIEGECKQFVIFERVSERAARNIDTALLVDDMFARPLVKATRSSTSSPVVLSQIETDEQDYIDERMRHHFPEGEYPEFAGFVTEDGQTVAMFRNHPADGQPNSRMTMDFGTVQIRGSDPLDCKRGTRRLPLPLGDMIEKWRNEVALMNAVDRNRSPVEESFSLAATDYQTASAAIGDIVAQACTVKGIAHTTTLISAPEGVSKTRSLMHNLPDIIAQHEIEARHHTATMFAFATYEAAQEKAAELENMNHPLLKPILIKSFSKLYEEWAEANKEPMIGFEAADAGNYETVLSAIRDRHPQALQYMEDYNLNLWRGVRPPQRAVFFTVHAVAQVWHHKCVTRLIASPLYIDGRVEAAFADNYVRLLVHDEVGPDDLIEMHHGHLIEFVDSFRPSYDETLSDIENYRAFNRFIKHNAVPKKDNGRQLDYSDAKVLLNFKATDAVEIVDHQEYGEFQNEPFYRDEIGRKWSWCKTDWIGRARNTVLLTAERLPCHIARWRGDIEVIELDTPLIDFKPTTLKSVRISAKTIGKYAQELQKLGKVDLVSNSISDLKNSRSHLAAKGLNSYMGKPVHSIFHVFHPAIWSHLEGLNAIMGRNDCVRLRHLDEINQTIGRNMGFRYRDGASHTAHLNSRLFEAVRPLILSDRYPFTIDGVPQTARRRKYIKRKVAETIAQTINQPHQSLSHLTGSEDLVWGDEE